MRNDFASYWMLNHLRIYYLYYMYVQQWGNITCRHEAGSAQLLSEHLQDEYLPLYRFAVSPSVQFLFR